MNNNAKDEEYEIDLLRLAGALWRSMWIIVLSILGIGAGTFLYSRYMITPLYESSAMFYINNSSISVGASTISLTDLNASISLVDTYIVILKARTTLNEVIRRAGLSYSYEELSEMVSATDVDRTQIFRVTVTSHDAAEATRIANTIAQVLPDRVDKIIDGSSARIVDYAVVPWKKASPNNTKNAMIGMLAGFLLSAGAIVLVELLDERIRDEDYVSDTYGLPILASVPDLLGESKKKKYKYYSQYSKTYSEAGGGLGDAGDGRKKKNDNAPPLGSGLSFEASEAYRLLRTNLLFSLPSENKCRVIGISSSGPGEGKSTTAMNLSYMLAEAGMKVLLLEGDMRLPTAATRVQIEAAPGLSNLLAGVRDEAEVVQHSSFEPALGIITAGDIPPNPSELLGSANMKRVIDKFSRGKDYIIVDLPPVNEVADAMIVSPLMDGYIVVVRQNYVSRRALADAMRDMGQTGCKILGFVLTRSGSSKRDKYKSYKYYGNYEKGSYGEQSRQQRKKEGGGLFGLGGRKEKNAERETGSRGSGSGSLKSPGAAKGKQEAYEDVPGLPSRLPLKRLRH